MNDRRPLAALLLVAALACPSRAAADEPNDVDRATARALTLEGYDALDHKDFATAADRFRRADSLYHVPTVALGLAHAEVGLGKLVSALSTYSRIVRDGVPPKAPPAFSKAVEDARRELDALVPRIPSVVVAVRGASDAKVTIDGIDVPPAALGVKRPVDPGAHVVRATAPGFAPSEVKLTVLEGKMEAVTLDLVPERQAPPLVAPPPPPLVVAPPIVVPPPPIARPETPPPASSSGSTQRTVGFVGLGLGGAGLVLGAITGGLAVSKHASLLVTCPDGSCRQSQKAAVEPDVDTYHTLAAVSTAGFIAGGALVAGGAILLLTAPRAHVGRDASITPVLGPGYAGAEGSF